MVTAANQTFWPFLSFQGKFSHINFREDLYLGGYTALAKIADRVGSTLGYAGCVRRLQVNDKAYDMRKGAFVGDAIQGIDIGRWMGKEGKRGVYG